MVQRPAWQRIIPEGATGVDHPAGFKVLIFGDPLVYQFPENHQRASARRREIVLGKSVLKLLESPIPWTPTNSVSKQKKILQARSAFFLVTRSSSANFLLSAWDKSHTISRHQTAASAQKSFRQKPYLSLSPISCSIFPISLLEARDHSSIATSKQRQHRKGCCTQNYLNDSERLEQ